MKSIQTQLPDIHGLSIWIDSYDEIFSDFDPRPFSLRTVSDDFILQVRKISREFKSKVISLKILVPAAVKNNENEKAIKKRLENHFVSMNEKLLEEGRSIRTKGYYFVTAGILLMFISGYLNFLNLSNFSIILLLAVFEPGGWFLFWTGLDQLLNFSRNKQAEIEFYQRMSIVHVEFMTY